MIKYIAVGFLIFMCATVYAYNKCKQENDLYIYHIIAHTEVDTNDVCIHGVIPQEKMIDIFARDGDICKHFNMHFGDADICIVCKKQLKEKRSLKNE